VASPPGNELPVHFQDEEKAGSPPTIIEVKCPFSAKDMTVAMAASTLKSFFLGKFYYTSSNNIQCNM